MHCNTAIFNIQNKAANSMNFYWSLSSSSAYFSKSEFSNLIFLSLSSEKYHIFQVRVQADKNTKSTFGLDHALFVC